MNTDFGEGFERAYANSIGFIYALIADGKKEVAREILEAIKKHARSTYLLSDPPKIMLEILEQDLDRIIQEVTEE